MNRTLLFASIATLTFAGCKDPAEGTQKAEVAEAKAPQAATAEVDAPKVERETLPISSENSKITFVGSKVTGKHDGGFNDFKGTIELDPQNFQASSIQIEIDMNSVWSDNERLTGHLKTGDFFLVEEHPTATFTSTEIKEGGADGASHTITGNLTMRGVTKSVTFPANITVGPEQVTASSTFALPRKQFGVAYAGAPDDLIRDDVIITLDVKAPRNGAQPAAAPAAQDAGTEPAAPAAE